MKKTGPFKYLGTGYKSYKIHDTMLVMCNHVFDDGMRSCQPFEAENNMNHQKIQYATRNMCREWYSKNTTIAW